jgi:hypothetical protein
MDAAANRGRPDLVSAGSPSGLRFPGLSGWLPLTNEEFVPSLHAERGPAGPCHIEGERMKTWFISLALAWAVGTAMADEIEMEGPAKQADSATAQTRMSKPKHPPRGDLRYCLDLKTNEAIIRCAEKKSKKK